MPKPWELDWSAGAPAPDALPLPIVPFFGRQQPPMLGEAARSIYPAAVPGAGPYGMSPVPDLGGPPAAADPLATQGGSFPAVAPGPSAMPAVAEAAGAGGSPFAQPAVYDDWSGPALQAGISFGPEPADAVPAPRLPSGQAPLMLAQQVLSTNGFPDAPPRPAPSNTSQGAPRLSLGGYAPPLRQPELRTYGLPVMPMPEPNNPSRGTAAGATVNGRRPPIPDPFSAENLSLGPNTQYRNHVVTATQQGPLTPEGLAAILGGEANLGPRGRWDPNSATGESEARGLGQFTPEQWEQDARRRGSYLNGVARSLGWLDRRGNIVQAHRQEFLNLRFDPRHSIYATADLARHNLAVLDRAHLILDRSPAALAQYAYIAHHEGLTGAINVLRGTRHITERVWNRNVPRAERQGWLAANGNNRDRAYLAWLAHYAAERVEPRNYMNDSRNVTVPAPEALYPRPQSRR
jgi:hypothetical protein